MSELDRFLRHMMDANKATIRRWFEEVWNQGSERAIDEIFSPNGVAHGIGETEPDLRGPDDFKPFVRNLRTALPDIRIDVEDAVAEADMVCVRLVLQGTHTGDGLGIPPTGRYVRVTGLVMARMVNGQMIEAWNNWDQLGLLRQIGAMPVVEGADRFTERRS